MLRALLFFFFHLLVALVLLAHEETAAVRVPEMIACKDCKVVGLIKSEVFDK